MPVKHKLLRKGTDTRRYVNRNANVQDFNLVDIPPDGSRRNTWVIFDTGKTNAFYIAAINPAGASPLELNRVVYQPMTATCTLQSANLAEYAVSIDGFFGDTSHARYGLKNSFSFVFLTGVKEDFSWTLRRNAFIVLFVSIFVAITLGIVLAVKASAQISSLMQMAIDAVTKQSDKVKLSAPENPEIERQNLI